MGRHSDAPINIPVNDWRLVHLHPILAHVHVVHCCDQGHPCPDVQRNLPVVVHSDRLCEKEESGGDHGNANDPTRNDTTIVWWQESLRGSETGFVDDIGAPMVASVVPAPMCKLILMSTV